MNRPELREFDQFEDNTELLGSLLSDGRIDVCMDDGHHSNESILCTMKSVVPYLADPFVYFIEDNSEVHSDIRATYPEYRVESRGEFTIMTSR